MNRCLVFLPAVLLATGCMSTYRHPPGAPAAQIAISDAGVAWVCNGDEPRILRKGEDGLAVIPAGERISVGLNYVASGYNVTYSCFPHVNFVPEIGAVYHQDFETEAEACTALVYRKTDDRRIGLAMEPTLDREGGDCVYKD